MQGAGDIHGRGSMHGGGGGMHGRGMYGMGGGMCGRGMCLVGETATAPAGTHPTRMHYCLK